MCPSFMESTEYTLLMIFSFWLQMQRKSADLFNLFFVVVVVVCAKNMKSIGLDRITISNPYGTKIDMTNEMK